MWIYDYRSERDNPYREQPFVSVVHMSYIDNLPSWSYPWHKHHNAFEVCYIMDGVGHLDVGAQHFPLETGSIALIPPGTSHRYAASDGSEVRYHTIRFLSKPEDGELQSYFRSLGTAITSGLNYLPYIQHTMRLLFDTHHVNGGIVDGTFQTIVLSLLQLTRTLFSNHALTLRLDSQYSIGDILDYIDAHRKEKITLSSLAHQFNISESHLNRLFQQIYHISPINYLIQCRIVMATEYLAKTGFTIAEIAREVGYDNPAHFTNMFTKRIGCSPAQYRERAAQNPLGVFD